MKLSATATFFSEKTCCEREVFNLKSYGSIVQSHPRISHETRAHILANALGPVWAFPKF